MTNKNFLKIISVNLLVLIFLLVVVEVFSLAGRLLMGKEVYTPFLEKISRDDHPGHPCEEMKTDVLLTHIPNTQGKCKVPGGSVVDDYVVYRFNNNLPSVLTLGGSTTSGFYTHFNNGKTWPYLYSNLVSDRYNVINGGVGAYGSLHESLKIFRDIKRFKNIKLVISLSGINDTPDYSGPALERSTFYPFMTEIQDQMNLNNTWIDQRYFTTFTRVLYQVMPNTFSGIYYYLIESASKGDSINAYSNRKLHSMFKKVDNVTQWEININRSREMVRATGAEYLVFLQPTMGLEGRQSVAPLSSPDWEMLDSMSEGYQNKINSLYDELKKVCDRYDFCIDISDYASPDGNLYHDKRHHNERGNKIIADVIFQYTKSILNIE